MPPREFEALLRQQLKNFLQRNNASALLVAAESGDQSSAIYASMKHMIMEMDEVSLVVDTLCRAFCCRACLTTG